MAHEVEQMAYVGQVPWHGLGNVLQPGATIDEWRKNAGLDWSVNSSPVQYKPKSDGVWHTAASRKVLFRSDTLDPLSIVGKDYKPVQPADLLEFYRDLVADMGFTIETAGSLKSGLKVWAMANTGDSAFLRAQDELRGYLLLATSYDGTFATTAQFTSVRVVCNNTLQMSLNGESGAIKIGHRSDFNPTEVKAQLGLSRQTFDAFIGAADTLTRIQVGAARAKKFFHDVMQVPIGTTKQNEQGSKNIAVAMTVLYDDGTGRGAQLDSARGTAWGAVNTVTEYLDHIRRQTKPGGRLDSAWFGTGAAIKQRAWTEALALA
jgi:phage/plasmid-like protein (TIGR03299 family)